MTRSSPSGLEAFPQIFHHSRDAAGPGHEPGEFGLSVLPGQFEGPDTDPGYTAHTPFLRELRVPGDIDYLEATDLSRLDQLGKACQHDRAVDTA